MPPRKLAIRFPPLATNRDQMRLLKFQGRDRNGRLAFSLSAQSLKRRFVALSYTWESAELIRDANGELFKPLAWRFVDNPQQERIIVNGIGTLIRPNLYHFLQIAVRQRLHDVPFFADQICINQGNQDEVAQLLRLMGQVYSKAEEVLSWLPPLVPINDALRRLHSSSLFRTLNAEHHSPTHQQHFESFNSIRVNKNFKWIAIHIRRNLMSPYWTRQWVTQEVCLAKKLTLQIGELTFPWFVILRFLWIYEHYEGVIVKAGVDDDKPPHPGQGQVQRTQASSLKLANDNMGAEGYAMACVKQCDNLLSFKQINITLNWNMHCLGDAMSTMLPRHCSRRRDHTYSILGMAKTEIVPNYSMSMALLYLQLLKEGFCVWGSNIYDYRDSADRVPSTVSTFLFACCLDVRQPAVMLVTKRMAAHFGMDCDAQHTLYTKVLRVRVNAEEEQNPDQAEIAWRDQMVKLTLDKRQQEIDQTKGGQQMTMDDYDDVSTNEEAAARGRDFETSRTKNEWLKMVDDLVPGRPITEWR